MALLTVRITSEDGTVRELELEPGAQIEVAEGDKVEILDSEGRPIEILADGDDVIVTIVAEAQQTVIIDGIVRGGGAAEEEEFIFENLALYIEDETGSSIAFFDPDTEEVTVVASIEDLLAGISTAAGDTGGTEGTFGPSPEAVQNIANLGEGPGIPGQDPPIAINFVPEADQSDIADEEAPPPEPISGILFVSASGSDGEGNLTADDALEGQFIRVVASVDIAPVGTPLVLSLSPTGTLENFQDDFEVTIEVGAFAGGIFFDAPGDDVFIDPSTVTFSIISAEGGGYDDLVAEVPGGTTDGSGNPTVSVDVDDTTDTVTATLTSRGSGDEDDGSVTYTVDLTGSPGAVDPEADQVFDVVLNTQTIQVTVLAGATSGSTTVAWGNQTGEGTVGLTGYPDSDVFLESDFTLSVSSITAVDNAGNYENLVTADSSTGVVIGDTPDTVTATLTATPSTGEDSGSITYTVTLSSSDGLDVTGHGGVSFTLANGETVTIDAGQASGSTDVDVERDDILLETDSIGNSIASVVTNTDSEFENLTFDSSAVSTTITDDSDEVVATLTATSSTGEDGGIITYTVTLTNSDDLDVTVHGGVSFTLANGETVTIDAGQASGSTDVDVERDDILLETDSIGNSIASVVTNTDSEFENLTFDSSAVSTTITDDSDEVVATLTATSSTGEDGGTITYTVTLTNSDDLDVTVHGGVSFTLANGETVTIDAGQASGSTDVDVERDDILLETDSIGNSIASVVTNTDSEFENLTFDSSTVSTTITDDSDEVVATLTATSSTGEDGGIITYTVTLTNSDDLGVTVHGGVSFTLANGETVTIDAGQASGSTDVDVERDDILLETDSIGNSIASVVTNTDSEFENLTFDSSAVSTTITDDSDEVVATLTADVSSIDETGGNIETDSIENSIASSSGDSEFENLHGDADEQRRPRST